MERFDAVVIGAGPEGLIAAHRLARDGLRVVVLERAPEPGGRAVTHEFHPGFRASPYADELPLVPRRLLASLNLAQHGGYFMPASASACFTSGRMTVLYKGETCLARASSAFSAAGIAGLRRESVALRAGIAERATIAPARASRLAAWARPPRRLPWPGEALARQSLDSVLATHIPDAAMRAHFAAYLCMGRAVSPFLPGSALHQLGGAGSGMPAGGMGGFTAALALSARAAGVHIRCGVEVRELRTVRNRVTGVVLQSGEVIDARAVVSSLDIKRTFAVLAGWSRNSDDRARRVAHFRMGGGRARILFALDRVPEFVPGLDDAVRGPLHVAEPLSALVEAHERWSAGIVGAKLPVTLRFPSLTDPRLAPMGKAVMTATLSCVPARMLDGAWDTEKRTRLMAQAIAAAAKFAPGIVDSIVGFRVILPSEIESALGLTDGDLDGGEIAPDQCLGFRPFAEWQDGHTPIRGLYLGGPSSGASPFLTGASGEQAALALLADCKTGLFL